MTRLARRQAVLAGDKVQHSVDMFSTRVCFVSTSLTSPFLLAGEFGKKLNAGLNVFVAGRIAFHLAARMHHCAVIAISETFANFVIA